MKELLGKLKPVNIFYGDNRLEMQKALHFIKDSLVKKGMEAFNYGTYDCKENQLELALSSSNELPCFSATRLVVADNVDAIKDKEGEMILEYLGNPSPSTILIFVYRENPDKRTKIYKEVEKKGFTVSFDQIRQSKLPEWITNYVLERKKNIKGEHAFFIGELIGNDLDRLTNELNKLILFIGDRIDISLEDIEKIIPDIKVNNIFELIDAINERNLERSEKISRKLLLADTNHLQILAMITRNFRQIIQARVLKKQGHSNPEIFSKLKIQSFLTDKFVKSMERFNSRELQDIYESLYVADKLFKTSSVNKDSLLFEILTKSALKKN